MITGLDLEEVVPTPAHTGPTPEGLIEQMRREAFEFWGNCPMSLPPQKESGQLHGGGAPGGAGLGGGAGRGECSAHLPQA